MFPSINGTKMIAHHLAAIRKQFPMFEDNEYCESWVPSQLLVYDFKSPVNDCIELINDSDYGPVSSTETTIEQFKILKFQMLFHPEILAPIISKLCELSADPNYVTCFDGATVQLDVLSETESKYTFGKGYGDCPSGCLYNHYWQYSVTPLGVTLENEWEHGEKSLEGTY